MQQIMKTIKLQEQANQQKKGVVVSKPPEKEKIEIEEEEMPLKIKGKSRGKSRGSLPKESIKPSTVLPIDNPVKAPEKIVIASKKEAVFFK